MMLSKSWDTLKNSKVPCVYFIRSTSFPYRCSARELELARHDPVANVHDRSRVNGAAHVLLSTDPAS